MRTYAPAPTRAVLERLLEEPSLARGVVHHEILAAREAVYGDWPGWLDPRIRAGLAKRGIERPYVHQSDAIEAVHAGEDVVVVTPTASGKSLCYTVPVLQAFAEDPSARALFLFPTKALGQDQVAELTGARPGRRARDLVGVLRRRHARADPLGDPQGRPGRGDQPGHAPLGDPPPPHQVVPAVRAAAVIVVDELHTYRGVFGSHVANVLRRLLRLCAHYGSHPVIVCCSATIGNPTELAETLTGRPSRRHRPQRRAVRREARGARRSADRGRLHGRRGFGARPRAALGAALPARRPPDDRVRAVAGRRRDPALDPARGAARGSRAAQPGPRLPRRLPAHGAALHRARACETARSSAWSAPTRSSWAWTSVGWTWRCWPATRARSRPRGSRWAAPAGGATSASRSSSPSAGARGPVRHPPPGVRARRPARGGAPGPGQPPRPARPPPGGHLRAAVRARRVVRARARRRPARVPRRGRPRPPGGRRPLVLELGELPGVGGLAAGGRAGERGDHRHDAGPAAGVLGEVDLFARAGARPRARDLHPRVASSTTWTVSTGASARRTSTGSTSDHYTYANRAVTLKPLGRVRHGPGDRRPSASTARSWSRAS